MPSRLRFPGFGCLLLLLCSAWPASAAHAREMNGEGGEPCTSCGVQ